MRRGGQLPEGLYERFSVCSFTMGSQRLYDFVHNNPSVLFKSSTFSNDPYTIARNNKFVSVNASLEIDLTGQCASETVGNLQWSGTGGQSETVQGAQMSPGGKSIIAMHSTYSATDADGKEVLHSKLSPSWRGAPRSPLPETTPTTWSRSMVSPGCGD